MWKSTSASGAPDNSLLSRFSAMMRPSWLGRAARNRHRHAIEQASRRWRRDRRDDLERARRKILISTQAPACLLDATAAQVLLGSGLVQAAATNLAGALDHLEKMLYAQLRDAVGKELTPQDFESYMVSHERKLFKPCYRPAPHGISERRSATAFPDGSLSLEDSERAPVAALSRRVDVPGDCLLYTSPSPRDRTRSRMPSSA